MEVIFMLITNYIREKTGLPIFNEGRWNEPFNENEKSYSSFNDAGVESEVGEFLYAMVRMLKPARVLETGTHHGVSAIYMGLALEHNHGGILDTIEFSEINCEIARRNIKRMQFLNREVQQHMMSSFDFTPIDSIVSGLQYYKLMFLDTEPQIRFAEFLKFNQYLEKGGYLFIHDCPRTLCQGNYNPDHPEWKSFPFGDIPQEMREIVKREYKVIHFPTPRGLTGFYKLQDEDYEW